MFADMEAAIRYIFQTRRRLDRAPRGLDEYTRDISATRSPHGSVRACWPANVNMSL